MKQDRATRSWMLIFTGCFFIVSWLLSFTPQVAELELNFYRQLLELSPAQAPGGGVAPFYLVEHARQYVLLAAFGLILLHWLLLGEDGLGLTFVILGVFVLFMAQLVLAVFIQRWLPAVWAGGTFFACSLVLHLWANHVPIRRFLFPSPDCGVPVIRRLIGKKAYADAVALLRECPFNDALYDVAYDLGVQLEQDGHPALAREVYVWMMEYDPAMGEFVDRIDGLLESEAGHQDPANAPLTKQDQFGHFELLGRKTRGATATVYEAQDMNTHRHVALKIFNQSMHEKGDQGERDILGFLREAITVSGLDHPNIVKIHDADVLGGRAYIAMDYIPGYPMSERIRRRKFLTAAESLRIMRSVLSALVLAQQKGVIHGDIKPANIMYDKSRDIYIITDFGAAFSQHRGVVARAKGGERKIVGTPAYMSPEQLSGKRADGRSDLFSLAVTIYHLLSGVQPFQGEGLPELKDNVLHREVDLGLLSVPDSIRQILRKALEKKPYRRFADASQMLHSVLYCQQKLVEKKQL